MTRERITRRQILAAVGVFGVSFGVAYAVRLAARPPRRLMVENFRRVKVGMTQAEVESLLGGPPGNYGRYSHGAMTAEGALVPPGLAERLWNDDNNMFELYFDPAGRLVTMHKRAGYQGMPSSESWFVRQWRWARRQLGI